VTREQRFRSLLLHLEKAKIPDLLTVEPPMFWRKDDPVPRFLIFVWGSKNLQKLRHRTFEIMKRLPVEQRFILLTTMKRSEIVRQKEASDFKKLKDKTKQLVSIGWEKQKERNQAFNQCLHRLASGKRIRFIPTYTLRGAR